MDVEKYKSFKKFIEELEVDINELKPINKEAMELKFNLLHIKSDNFFVKYLISCAQTFEQYLSVDKSDTFGFVYIFKCSVKECPFSIYFHKTKGKNTITLFKDKCFFSHKIECHERYPPKVRMSQEVYDKFKEMSLKGLSISDFMISCPGAEEVDITRFYGIKTKINKQMDSLKYVESWLSKMQEFAYRNNYDNEGQLISIVVINRLVVTTPYCDILIIDDTVGLDNDDYPIQCIVCRDANGKIQIPGFGYLPNKREEGFEMFFEDFKKLAEEERKNNGGEGNFASIFVCDRLKAQSNAIQKVFQNAKIIYCKHHVEMDIERKCAPLMKAAYNMLENRTPDYEKAFLDQLAELKENNIRKNKDQKDKEEKSNFYTCLENDTKCFLPSIIDKYYHRNTLTSNNAETVFSAVKRNFKRKYPKSLVINLFVNLSMKWLMQSIKKPISIPISLQGRVNELIGQTALDYIIAEEISSIQIRKNECNCNTLPIRLPCCHYLLTHKTEKIEVPKEYLRLKCNFIREKKMELKSSKNETTQIDMEEVNLDFNKAVKQLNEVKTKESQHFKNEITYYINTDSHLS